VRAAAPATHAAAAKGCKKEVKIFKKITAEIKKAK
jgi:hypothetical protein